MIQAHANVHGKVQPPWHTLQADEVASILGSDLVQGLATSAVRQRQALYGPNQIQRTGGRSRLQIWIDQFTNIMLLMLMGVAIVSAVLDLRAGNLPKDAIAIFAIVLLNGILGYLQESRAEQALEALNALSAPVVTVVRNGQPSTLPSEQLVPGDLVWLAAGDQIAADGRLLDSPPLQVREAALTGESIAVAKRAAAVLPVSTALGDRCNLVFQGTEVVSGKGRMLVTATGMATELGHIADLLQSVEAEATPLQQRMGQLANALVFGSLLLVAVVIIGGVLVLGKGAFEQLLIVSLSMAVAVVPEGLPAVITVTLALGTQRMVKRQALIRRLPAVETLGSVTTICSDKTGTLTQNKMVVQSVHCCDADFTVTGHGYGPEGQFWQANQVQNPLAAPDLALLLLDGLLCNDARLQSENDEWTIVGDPTEGALLTLAAKAGLMPDQLPCERQLDFPFSSERKRMSVVVNSAPAVSLRVGGSAPYLLLAKGSPEILLERCNRRQQHPQIEAMTARCRQQIRTLNEHLAGQGKRVLGFAYRPLDTLPADAAAAEADLIWLGLVGMSDAPRPEVAEAVKRCQQAGIRTLVITGDHPLTAQTLAIELGITPPHSQVLTGQQLEAMSQSALETAVQSVNVYARVSPEHKLRIVRALQTQHQVVAMTGDGVNDAPALKQAEIGIAMGITGTEVSKQASDMILLDDNFASIVAAAEEGRVVYSNIRRFIKYILGSNIGELLTIALSPLLLPIGAVPLTPLQILWMNLVTDGFPALALAMEPAEPNIMQRPPYNPQESIFARGLGLYMIRVGLVFTAIAVLLMTWAYHYTHQPAYIGSPDTWKTMVFTMLCLAQMGHAISVRSDNRLVLEMSPLSNPFLLLAVVLTTILQLLLIYMPPLRAFFGTQRLSLSELAICFGFSALLFVWIELEKLWLRNRWGQQSCQ